MARKKIVIEPCQCGREPEIDTNLQGHKHSIGCRCGKKEFEYIQYSNDWKKMINEWNRTAPFRRPGRSELQYNPPPEESSTTRAIRVAMQDLKKGD